METRRKCIEYLGGKCSRCGYDKCDRAIEFHHINPSEKDFTIGHRTSIIFDNNPDFFKRELDKCILLCRNCHRKEHDTEELNVKFKPKNWNKRKDENRPCRELLSMMVCEMSVACIARIYKVKKTTVYRWVKEDKLNIPGCARWNKLDNNRRPSAFSKEELLPLIQNKTCREIDTEYNLGIGHSRRLCKKYKIETNDKNIQKKRKLEKLLKISSKENLLNMLNNKSMQDTAISLNTSYHNLQKLIKIYGIKK